MILKGVSLAPLDSYPEFKSREIVKIIYSICRGIFLTWPKSYFLPAFFAFAFFWLNLQFGFRHFILNVGVWVRVVRFKITICANGVISDTRERWRYLAPPAFFVFPSVSSTGRLSLECFTPFYGAYFISTKLTPSTLWAEMSLRIYRYQSVVFTNDI